ncbi:MAG TPA: hypothetical protein VMY78_18080 [Solirubrobacteraceae bacterium]|nr:hypothetical protein [Solirubrobacteraceae bacterium]
MSEHDDLLKRFRPELRYDSNEQFFADSAAQYTDPPGMTLRRGTAVLASSQPSGDQPKLALDFLGPKTYASGMPVDKIDAIGVRGRDYRTHYVGLRISRPELNNRMYGRAVEVNGRLWLQYWFWYFYNDYQLALGFGTHEGDWELVQLRMAPDGDEPDVAVYAQHRHGEKRVWSEVQRLPDEPDRPVVYIARGSHASYYEAGFHQTEAFYDVADGKRPAPELELEIVRDATHAWLRWPGRWGDTVPREKKLDLDQNSPTGPGTKKHWRNPDSLLDNAVAPVRRDGPKAPDVTVRRGRGNRLEITYDFTGRKIAPRALVVTVNSRNEKGVPPKTTTFEEVATKPEGTLRTDISVHPERHYDIYTSTVAGEPPVPSASTFSELDPVEVHKKPPLGQRIAKFFGGLLATIRGDRR